MSAQKLKAVVLECPYDIWNDPHARQTFCKVVALKFEGYRKEYNYGVLPVDATDFICTHHIVCDSSAEGLTPLMAYKSVTLRRCRIHNLSFPPLGLLRMTGSTAHADAVERIVQDCDRAGRELIYGGSMTITPQARANPELVQQLWEMIIASSLAYDIEHGVDEAVCFGTVRFKMHRIFHSMGYASLKKDGITLDPVRIPFVFNDGAGLFHRKAISPYGLSLVEKYKAWWKARIEIKSQTEKNEQQAA